MREYAPAHCFSGCDEDVYVWIRRIDGLAASYGWSDQQTLYRACALFTEFAADWLDTVQLSTWAELKSALVYRFADSPELLATKLFHCRQTSGETVAEYADRLQSLARRLALTHSSLPPCLMLRQFIQGLLPHLQSMVFTRHPSSLAEAINHALYFEQYHVDYRDAPQQRQRRAYNTAKDYRPGQEKDYNPIQHQGTHTKHQPVLPTRVTSPYAVQRNVVPRTVRIKQLQNQLTQLRLQLAEAAEAQLSASQVYTTDMYLMPESDVLDDDESGYEGDASSTWRYEESCMPLSSCHTCTEPYASNDSKEESRSFMSTSLLHDVAATCKLHEHGRQHNSAALHSPVDSGCVHSAPAPLQQSTQMIAEHEHVSSLNALHTSPEQKQPSLSSAGNKQEMCALEPATAARPTEAASPTAICTALCDNTTPEPADNLLKHDASTTSQQASDAVTQHAEHANADIPNHVEVRPASARHTCNASTEILGDDCSNWHDSVKLPTCNCLIASNIPEPVNTLHSTCQYVTPENFTLACAIVGVCAQLAQGLQTIARSSELKLQHVQQCMGKTLPPDLDLDHNVQPWRDKCQQVISACDLLMYFSAYHGKRQTHALALLPQASKSQHTIPLHLVGHERPFACTPTTYQSRFRQSTSSNGYCTESRIRIKIPAYGYSYNSLQPPVTRLKHAKEKRWAQRTMKELDRKTPASTKRNATCGAYNLQPGDLNMRVKMPVK